MKAYESLFKRHRDQPLETVFAHFYPINSDYDEPFKLVARQTIDGIDAWLSIKIGSKTSIRWLFRS